MVRLPQEGLVSWSLSRGRIFGQTRPSGRAVKPNHGAHEHWAAACHDEMMFSWRKRAREREQPANGKHQAKPGTLLSLESLRVFDAFARGCRS